MTHDEAIKVLEQNKGLLDSSMREALDALLKESRKVQLVKATLEKKRSHNRAVIEARAECGLDSYWMEGSVEGLGTAIWLLDADMEYVVKEAMV